MFDEVPSVDSETLSLLLENQVELLSSSPLRGGCISEVSRVTLRCDRPDPGAPYGARCSGEPRIDLVIKQHRADMVSNFGCEADGLAALAAADVIRVPELYAGGVLTDRVVLATQWSPSGGRAANGFSDFGRQLARLHRATSAPEHGWHRDNFLGSAHQPNEPRASWPDFFAEQRIGFQIRWATDQGLADPRLRGDCETIMAEMTRLLAGHTQQFSLLHGDLWSGNYLFDDAGNPALIDPAVYRGCREAEWGMITWMGGCPAEFQSAYQNEWPMNEGWQRRVLVYRLYHELNHMNLFGGSYLNQAQRTMSSILSTR